MEAPPNSPVTVNVYDMVSSIYKTLMLKILMLILLILFRYSSFYFSFLPNERNGNLY